MDITLLGLVIAFIHTSRSVQWMQAWWYVPMIPELGREKQENQEFITLPTYLVG